jgi:hypothetical protein
MLLYSIHDLFVSSVIYIKMNKDKLKLFQHYFQVLLMVCSNFYTCHFHFLLLKDVKE